jgi:hypothetical protein
VHNGEIWTKREYDQFVWKYKNPFSYLNLNGEERAAGNVELGANKLGVGPQ